MREQGTMTPETQDSDEITALVGLAMAGGRAAFERLVVMHQGGIFGMVYARMQSRADAEDVVQDVFLSAFRNLSTLRDPALFKAWLCRIALNKVRDALRRRRIASFFGFGRDEVPDDHPDPGPDGFDHAAARQFWSKVNGFLDTLPALQREVFRLRFLDHLGIQEIAVVMGKNESTVKTHLYRALDKFKTLGSQYGVSVGEDA